MKKYFVVALLMAFILGLHAQDTVKTYWSNKKLLSAGVKVNDKEEGHWIFYHKNGLKWTEGNYRHGERVGQWKTWYDDGRLSQEGYMDNGPFKSWYKSGQVESEGSFKNGKRNGAWTFYHSNGKLYKQCTYLNDSIDGAVTEFHDNGVK